MEPTPNRQPFIGLMAYNSAAFWMLVAITTWAITLFFSAGATFLLVFVFVMLPLMLVSNTPFFWVALTASGLCFYIAIVRNLVGKQRPTVWWTIGFNFAGLVLVLTPYRFEFLEWVSG